MLERLPDALGHALSDVRAGLDKTVFHNLDLRQGMAALQLGSLAFADHAPIPAKYTADGEGVSPPLHWSGVPAAAVALALIVEDADSPTPQPLVHAIAFDLPLGEDGGLPEGAMGGDDAAETGEIRSAQAVEMGRNSFLGAKWLPPDPPPGHGAHRYVFQLFALAAAPDGSAAALHGTPGRDALRDVLQARAVASGCLIGTYQRDGSITEKSPQSATASAQTAMQDRLAL